MWYGERHTVSHRWAQVILHYCHVAEAECARLFLAECRVLHEPAEMTTIRTKNGIQLTILNDVRYNLLCDFCSRLLFRCCQWQIESMSRMQHKILLDPRNITHTQEQSWSNSVNFASRQIGRDGRSIKTICLSFCISCQTSYCFYLLCPFLLTSFPYLSEFSPNLYAAFIRFLFFRKCLSTHNIYVASNFLAPI